MVVLRALVVGRGCVGLMSARALQGAGVEVVVVGREKEKGTTSAGAGGLWMPFHALPEAEVERWALETLAAYAAEPAAALAACLETLPAVQLFAGPKAPPPPGWSRAAALGFEVLENCGPGDLARAIEARGGAGFDVPPDYGAAYLWDTVVVDSPRYLEALEAAIAAAGATALGDGVSLADLDEAAQLARAHGCDLVVNAAGLGGADLALDRATEPPVLPGRGVVMNYKRINRRLPVISTETGSLATESTPAYVIPRGDLVVCGGSYDEGDARREATLAETDRIAASARTLAPGSLGPLEYVWVGLRPVRPVGVRVELERSSEKKNDNDDAPLLVAHNYGHGGSGWTIGIGTAHELLTILEDQLPTSA